MLPPISAGSTGSVSAKLDCLGQDEPDIFRAVPTVFVFVNLFRANRGTAPGRNSASDA
jgi:hypothetical protein